MRDPSKHYAEELWKKECNVRCRPDEHVHADVFYGADDPMAVSIVNNTWQMSSIHGHEPGVAILLETERAVEAPEPESEICRELPAWLCTFQYVSDGRRPLMKLDHQKVPRLR